MKLALREQVPAQYNQSRFQELFGQVERQGNLLAEGRIAGRHFTASSVPTAGDFFVGDIVWNSAPTNGGILGWICTASGSPGTLKAFGFIGFDSEAKNTVLAGPSSGTNAAPTFRALTIADLGFDSEAKNTVLAGPSSGTNAAPTFRALTIADLPALGQLTASLAADVNLNNTANYFDGPSVAQGSTGVWYASGKVVVTDTSGAVNFHAKLWDGTTVIDSAFQNLNGFNTMALSGYITNPAGNLRISVRDANATTGKILANQSGNSKDSTITAFRIA